MARETLASLKAEHERLNRVNAELAEALRQAKAPITNMADARLEPVWKKSHEAADEQGQCSVYDNILDSIGAPGRSGRADVTVRIRTRVPLADAQENAWRDRFENWLDDAKNPLRRVYPEIETVEVVDVDWL